jgi:glycosyltransferase involved in cell wall biosynthesis
LGIKVLFVPVGGERVASSRLRVYQYLDALKQLGIEPRVLRLGGRPPLLRGVSPALAVLRLLWGMAGADVVVIQKLLLSRRVWRLMALLGRPTIYDFDDAIYTSPHWLRAGPDQEGQRKDQLEWALSHSDAVIVSGEFLATYARQHNSRVHVIPTPIDTDRFAPGPQQPAGTLTIGWVGLKDNLHYLEQLGGVLHRLAARFPGGWALKVISNGAFELSGVPVFNQRWNLEREVEDLLGIDIGIMPLDMSDDAWTRGKTGTKAMQYMAMGIPAVVSAVEFTRRLIEDGTDGFLAVTEDEWFAKLSALLADESLRRRVGLAGRAVVERDYSLRANAPRLAGLIERIAGGYDR